MRNKVAKRLRKEAAALATEPYETTNENIDMKIIKTGRLVINDAGEYVEEQYPKIVFNTMMNKGCARKIYQGIKKEYYQV